MRARLPGLELFQRAAEARGQLLEVWRLDGGGESRAGSFLLTFDLGRIRVRVDPARGGLVAEHLQSIDELRGALEPAGEEEPWWRVLGNPIVRACEVEERGGRARGYRLQFRPDEDNPRVVSLRPEGNLVRAGLES